MLSRISIPAGDIESLVKFNISIQAGAVSIRLGNSSVC